MQRVKAAPLLRECPTLAKVEIMDTIDAATYEHILNIVHGWPPSKRFSLVQEVLRTLAAETASTGQRSPTLNQALGMLATDRPAPSDAEIDAWLDEHRMQKYG